ncbi:MAG: hypothetical protein UU85_C0010G0001, partial [Candidatus Wolfebacteria bacterium GW2011_GWA2_42_10]
MTNGLLGVNANGSVIATSSITISNATTTNLYVAGQTILAGTGGNVGIGTTTPNALLSIGSSTNTTIDFFRIATSTNQNIFFINKNGNAGLGLNPDVFPYSDYKLSVGGAMYVTGDLSVGGILSVADIDATTALFTNATTTNATSTSLYASIFNAVTSTLTNLLFTNATGTTLTLTTASSSNLLATNATTTTLYVSGQTNLYGNVAIGTTTVPISQFDVTGTGNVGMAIRPYAGYSNINLYDYRADSTTSFGIYNGYPAAGDFTIRENTVANRLVIKKTTGNIGIGTSTPYSKLTVWGSDTGSASLVNFVNSASTSLLTVLENGNVGIGTSTPYATLSVNGQTVALYYTATSTTQASTFPYASSTALTVSGSGYLGNLIATNASATSTLAGGLAIETSGFVYDYSTNNVGIGTASPSSILHLAGNDPVITFDDNAGGSPFDFSFGSTVAGQINLVDNTNSKTIYSYTGGSFTINTDTGAIPLYISRDGTTSQTGKLYVDDSSLYIESIQDENTAGFGNMIFRVDDDTTADGYFAFQTKSAVEYMRILDGGNVGIGTTTPASALHVLSATSPQLRLGYDSTNYTNFGIGTDGALTITPTGVATTTIANGLVVNTNSLVVQDATGNVGIGTTTPIHKLEVSTANTNTNSTIDYLLNLKRTHSATDATNFGTGISFADHNSMQASIEAVRTNSATTYKSGLVFKVNSGNSSTLLESGLTEAMRISELGYVGIGTASPNSQLHIAKTTVGGFGGSLQLQNIDGSESAGTYTGIQFGVTPNLATYLKGGIFYSIPDSGYAGYGKGDIVFAQEPNNNTTNVSLSNAVMTIKNGGNVGIATTTPTEQLTIGGSNAGTFALRSLTDPTNYYFKVNNAYSAAKPWYITGYYGHEYLAAAGNDLILQSASGNVGIGTTTPTYPLTLQTSAGAGTTILGLYNSYSGATSDNRNWAIGTNQYAYGDLHIMNSTASGGNAAVNSRLVITKDGNVGIGTTVPGKALEINSATGASLRLTYNDADGSATNYTDLSVGSDGALTISPANSATTTIANGLVVNTNSLVVQDATGNVGIGTASPGANLDVIGTASADSLLAVHTATDGYDSRLFLGETTALTYGMTMEYDGTDNIGYIGMNNNVVPTGAWSKRIQMSRTGTEVAFMAGNVGIGTSSPQARLHVNVDSTEGTPTVSAVTSGLFQRAASSASSNYLSILAGSAGQARLTFGDKDAQDTGYLQWDNAINSFGLMGGNVGIGTTTPGSLLQVGNATSYFKIDSGNATTTGYLTVGSAPSGALYTSGNLNVQNAAVIGTTLSAGTSTLTNLIVQNVSTSTFNGNILITSPYPGTGNTPGSRSFMMDTINSVTGHVAQTGMQAIFARIADTDFSSRLAFFTATDNTSVERMRIDQNGNVGIGTVAPLSKLSINGGLHVGGDSDAGDNNLLVDGTGTFTGNLYTTSGLIYANQTTGSLSINTGSSYNNGPAMQMFGGTHATRAGEVAMWTFGSTATSHFKWYNESSADAFSELMRLTQDGKLGIGKTPS